MDFNINYVIEESIRLHSPTEVEIELARKRLEICQSCDSSVEKVENGNISMICGECECPLSKLSVFPEYNVCDLHRWRDCDKGYFNIKTDISLI